MSLATNSDTAEERYDPRARLGECVADKWTLEEVLGVGGMAAVYAATHRNGHRTAIKMLLPETARDESLVRRFLREGYIANKVPHDGAVRVIDDGRADDGSPFLVMERLHGTSLEGHANGRAAALTMREAFDVMLGLLEILEAAHDVGVVHRDVKPANIFRTTSGELKLLDFGIAVLVESGPRAGATVSGVVIGTPAFMAPEQARGRHELVGPRSDLWAVAASGLSLMIGGRLRSAITTSEELAMAALQPLPPASTFAEALAGHFGDVLDRALNFEPGDRFSNAREMREALEQCRGEALPVRLDAPVPKDTLPLVQDTLVAPPLPHASVTVQGGYTVPPAPLVMAPAQSNAPASAESAREPRERKATGGRALGLLGVIAVLLGAAGVLALRTTSKRAERPLNAETAATPMPFSSTLPPAAAADPATAARSPVVAPLLAVPAPPTIGSTRAKPAAPARLPRTAIPAAAAPSRRPDFMDER